MEKIILAYCHENARLAKQIDEKLHRSGIRFDHVSDEKDRLPGQFVAAVQSTNAPVILLVTDNFLRSQGCMAQAQPMLQQLLRTNRVLPVVADGFRANPSTGHVDRVETNFERVIHAITYMNYWQSVYLELRQKKDHVGPEAAEALDREVRNVRDISVEIGDFLNTLRNAEYVRWDNFSANQFELFFRKFGVTDLYQQYRQVAAADPVFEETEDEAEPVAIGQTPPPLPEISPKIIEIEPEPTHFEEKSIEPETDIWEKQTGLPPEFVPEQTPFWAENDGGEGPLFDAPPFDILKELDKDLDEKTALAAARSRKKKLATATAPPKIEAEKAARKTKPKAPKTEAGPGTETVFLEKTTTETADQNLETPLFEEKTGRSGPVEIQISPRKLMPIPETPTHAEIEALVAEIVREEAAMAEARAAVSDENLVVENNGKPPYFDGENEAHVEGTRDEDEPQAENELSSRPVSAMQLPHFQPVSAASTDTDDIRLTQADAHFWLEKSEFDEARLQAEELAMKYPARAEGWFLLGEIAESAGDYVAARQYWEKTVVIEDEFPEAHLRLAKLLDQNFKTEKKEAVRHYRAAAKNDPADASSLYRAGSICLENLGKHEKARRFFQKTVERDPAHAVAWYDLAHLERHLGNFDEAADAWERAISLDPALKTEIEARLFLKKTVSRVDFPVEKLAENAVEILAEKLNSTQNGFAKKEDQPVENQPVASKIEPQVLPKSTVLTVLITGATSGIGRATAEIFAKNGHRVLMTGRRAERLAEIEMGFSEAYENDVLTACFDVRDRQSVEQMVENLPENWRDIDLLINNAGLAKGLDPIHEADFEHWEAMIDTNLKGLLYMTRLIAPGMVARRRGHIINIGSIAGKEVYPKGGVYNATKFAVDALTRTMRLDLVPYGVKVSSVSPGAVEETEFSLVRFDGDAERAQIYGDFRPLTSGDVAEAIYFMATRPAHVAIHDIVLTGAQQASATLIDRSGR